MHYVSITSTAAPRESEVMIASCTCGWRGTWQETKEEAEEQGLVHMQTAEDE